MKIKILLILFIVVGIVSCNNIKYPDTEKGNQTDVYFGTEVKDPYRWLENDTSQQTKDWVRAENKVTFNYLAKIPFRDDIKNRLNELWDYTKVSTPFKSGGYYFFFKNEGLQNQSIMYIQEDLDSTPRVILDPNKFSDDGTVSLAGHSISKDGKYLAYSLASGGSDWREIFVKEIESGKLLKDNIKRVKFSNIAWYKDGFYYSRYDAPSEGLELSKKNKFHKVCYHKLGDPVENDSIVFQNKNFALRNYTADISEDKKYLFIYETESTSGNNLFIKNLTKDDGFIQLTTNFNYEYRVLDHINDKLIVHTNYNAAKYKLVKIDVNSLDIGNWIDIIPEKKDVLESCDLVGGKIIATYLQDAHSKLEVYNYKGDKLNNIELPSLGSVYSVNGNVNCDEAFFNFSSFTSPGMVYKYDVSTNQYEEYFKPDLDFDSEDYVTKQVFYKSKDGTKIPMFIVHKKNIKLDGTNPTLLYGYGGFNISLKPSFRVSRLVWLQNGGVYAMANLRGGGEYGENWHRAGTKLNKQNVFDDFIAAGEYLIKEKYTSSEKLAINGASNGGLLVGAVTNQRPELFDVAIPEVGVMDMLRFQKFTIGWAWVSDYGSSEDSVQFVNLYSYSPIHNIKENLDYPAIMVKTADHDDRVVPAHSFKYIATLQDKYKGNNPTLIRIQTKAGHGAGKPTSIKIQEAADFWSFIFYNMNEQPKF
ncbi:MAG: prolyl oligopeptidase family serine peptidase [Bacteroidales bacterium]|jgi:prolyl oligopeptidase|nr:prolyl oligopeptidase family serine peptidase [Bacteroidales bacterium]